MDARSIITRLGGYAAVASGLGRPNGTVSAWTSRNSIPAQYWGEIIRLAQASNVHDVTLEALAAVAETSSRSAAAAADEAA